MGARAELPREHLQPAEGRQNEQRLLAPARRAEPEQVEGETGAADRPAHTVASAPSGPDRDCRFGGLSGRQAGDPVAALNLLDAFGQDTKGDMKVVHRQPADIGERAGQPRDPPRDDTVGQAALDADPRPHEEPDDQGREQHADQGAEHAEGRHD
jgi:hypothetical protein